MKEINELTRQLLAEGYTEERYPEYVKKYDWFYGGFTYKEEAKRQMVFKTPCGLYCKYESILEGMSYGGYDWSIEYGRGVCFCPYHTRTTKCLKNNQVLEKLHAGTHYEDMHYCHIERVEEPYDYEKSVERQKKLNEQEQEQKLKEYTEKVKGHICYSQLHYNRSKQEYWQSSDVRICIINNCDFCTLRQRELTGKKAHIVYDIKTTGIIKGIGMIPDETTESVSRNHKFTTKPIHEDLARLIVKQAVKEINWKLKSEYHVNLFFGDIKSVEAINVRVEKKLKHDIYQDLALIAEGITVSYADVQEKQAKETKSRKRAEAQQKKIDSLVKKYIAGGYEALGQKRYMFEKLADKGEIDLDDIEERRTEYLRRQEEAEEQEQRQLSFF
jgi:hypothetical protein